MRKRKVHMARLKDGSFGMVVLYCQRRRRWPWVFSWRGTKPEDRCKRCLAKMSRKAKGRKG